MTTSARTPLKKVTLNALAVAVERLLDRPVVDMTGIAGSYDFSLEYSWDEVRSLVRASSGGATELPANPDAPGNSIFTSVAAFGLRLEARKAPIEVVVVDRIERIPTEN